MNIIPAPPGVPNKLAQPRPDVLECGDYELVVCEGQQHRWALLKGRDVMKHGTAQNRDELYYDLVVKLREFSPATVRVDRLSVRDTLLAVNDLMDGITISGERGSLHGLQVEELLGAGEPLSIAETRKPRAAERLLIATDASSSKSGDGGGGYVTSWGAYVLWQMPAGDINKMEAEVILTAVAQQLRNAPNGITVLTDSRNAIRILEGTVGAGRLRANPMLAKIRAMMDSGFVRLRWVRSHVCFPPNDAADRLAKAALAATPSVREKLAMQVKSTTKTEVLEAFSSYRAGTAQRDYSLD